ncbi:hypothetical protein Tco_0935301 [Tanacetum coccineum]
MSKPNIKRPDLKKRDPYTQYKDPHGFIYVDDNKQNRLMGSDELYKFSDGTLTRLLSSHKDITKNINLEYLPKSYFISSGVVERNAEDVIGGFLYRPGLDWISAHNF